jgi:hypothetical protein
LTALIACLLRLYYGSLRFYEDTFKDVLRPLCNPTNAAKWPDKRAFCGLVARPLRLQFYAHRITFFRVWVGVQPERLWCRLRLRCWDKTFACLTPGLLALLVCLSFRSSTPQLLASSLSFLASAPPSLLLHHVSLFYCHLQIFSGCKVAIVAYHALVNFV